MDNMVLQKVWQQGQRLTVDDLSGCAFTGEDAAHTFEISGKNASGTVPISGTIAGKFLRSDNVTVPVTGTASDGVASITLTEDCYAVPGRFIFSVYANDGTHNICIYCGVGTVLRTDSGEYEGGEIITDVTALINAIETAVATIPADYSTLLAAIAPAFSASTAYAAGSYVWYDGNLYKFTADHAAGSWTGTDAAAVALANDVDDLKNAVGCDASKKSFSANAELMRVYPDQGAVYYIHGLSDSNVQYVDIYEYYSDETSTRLIRFSGNGEYNYYYTPASNASYVRVYIVPVSGNTGSATGQINDVTNAAKTLSGWVYRYAVMPYTSDSYLTTANNCMGLSGALALPDNKIFSVQAAVTQDVFSDLPEYGYASTIATFVPRLGRTDKATRMYLFANANGTACIGYGLSSRVTWTNISDKIDTKFQTMFGNPFTAFKATSSNAEITKFYPESGKEYDILLYGMAGYNTVKIYEFDTSGNYTEYASITGAETWNAHYTPSANTSYLRFYMTTSAQATASLAVLENPNVLSPLLNKQETSAADYMLSKEFAAVRKFTVIGDSMASGYYKESASGEQHGRNLEYSWPQIMARVYGMTSVNATQSGITTAGWWTDPNGYCKAMVTASNRSQVYVVGIGTNDYKDIPDSEITQEQIGSAADINVSDYTQNVDSFWGNYAKILQYIHDVAPDAKIICLTIPAPRPNTAWKQTAIRGICALSMFSDYVALCDLVADYNDLVNSEAMTSEMWQSHFTPVGYANSAELLMYALSKTIQNNLSMFINLPQIPYDS